MMPAFTIRPIRLSLLLLLVVLFLSSQPTIAQDYDEDCDCATEEADALYERFTENYAFPSGAASKREGAVMARDLLKKYKDCECADDVVEYLTSWLKRYAPANAGPKEVVLKVDGFYYGDEGWTIENRQDRRWRTLFLDRWRPANVDIHPAKNVLINSPNEVLVVMSPFADGSQREQKWYRVNCDTNSFKTLWTFTLNDQNKVSGEHQGHYGREEEWSPFLNEPNNKLLGYPCSKVKSVLKEQSKILLKK